MLLSNRLFGDTIGLLVRASCHGRAKRSLCVLPFDSCVDDFFIIIEAHHAIVGPKGSCV